MSRHHPTCSTLKLQSLKTQAARADEVVLADGDMMVVLGAFVGKPDRTIVPFLF